MHGKDSARAVKACEDSTFRKLKNFYLFVLHLNAKYTASMQICKHIFCKIKLYNI